jgi:lysozyme
MKTLKIMLSVIILLALVLYCSIHIIEHGVHGIDISHHNTVNWNVVAEQTETKFAFVKITEGSTFVDKAGKKHIREAEASGIKTGAYHYFSTRSSAKKQFENFKNNFVNSTSLVPMVDVEDHDNVSAKELNMMVREFCELIEAEYGVKPIVYTRPDLYHSVFVKNGFRFWRKYTFFFWQPIPVHPVFSTGRIRCIWQYSTNREKISGTSIIDRDVLSSINLSNLIR